jgi:acetyltransferase-like isoleucine patch superfamily enzyme
MRCLLYRLGGVRIGERVWIGRGVAVGSGVSIGRDTRIQSQVVIGNGAGIGNEVEIRHNAVIGSNVMIGNGTIIGENTLLQNCTIGDHSFVDHGVIFTGSGDDWIAIGRHCYIGIYAVLDRSGGIGVGDYVHIAGPAVGIWTHTTVYQCLASEKLNESVRRMIAPVKIENNVWIGGNTTIYLGVTIGHHSVILPNTAVAKDVGAFSMVGGVPARLKRQIEMDENRIRFMTARVPDRG